MGKDISSFTALRENDSIVEGKTRQDNGSWLIKDFNFLRTEDENPNISKNYSHYCKIVFINPITKEEKVNYFGIDFDNYNVKSILEIIINALNEIKENTFWVEYDIKTIGKKENK
jgi:hypothetical protein